MQYDNTRYQNITKRYTFPVFCIVHNDNASIYLLKSLKQKLVEGLHL